MQFHIISVNVLYSFIVEIEGMRFWACADVTEDLPYNISVGNGADRLDTFVASQVEVVKAIKKFLAGDMNGWERWE